MLREFQCEPAAPAVGARWPIFGLCDKVCDRISYRTRAMRLPVFHFEPLRLRGEISSKFVAKGL
jgi:hypothetical protein